MKFQWRHLQSDWSRATLMTTASMISFFYKLELVANFRLCLTKKSGFMCLPGSTGRTHNVFYLPVHP